MNDKIGAEGDGAAERVGELVRGVALAAQHAAVRQESRGSIACQHIPLLTFGELGNVAFYAHSEPPYPEKRNDRAKE